MKLHCPYCKSLRSDASGSRNIFRSGVYKRKSDGRKVRRFRCLRCRKYFSRAALHPAYRQKKRQVNNMIYRLLSAGVSERETARVLNLDRKTVHRKKFYISAQCEEKEYKDLCAHPPATQVEFDDMETFEHTKCKPISIPLFVEYKTRRILLLDVAQMPAKGKLAVPARKKYGFRKDHRKGVRRKLFAKVQPFISPTAIIRSDSNPHYPEDIKEFFPHATHQTVLSRRGAITAQGELKKQKYDPIFSLNHTCAMFRAHVGRLIRRTWNTTKKIEGLRAHLIIYAHNHNQRLCAR